MRTLLLYASNFFNETTQESKYSNDFLELPLNFSLNHCFEKYKTVMTGYLSLRGWGGGGAAVRGEGYEWRVSFFYVWICAFETICIQFPQDIQLHMKNYCMRKNSSNKRYTGTGAWVITEQMQTLYSVYGMFHYFRFWWKPLLATPKNFW